MKLDSISTVTLLPYTEYNEVALYFLTIKNFRTSPILYRYLYFIHQALFRLVRQISEEQQAKGEKKKSGPVVLSELSVPSCTRTRTRTRTRRSSVGRVDEHVHVRSYE